MPTIPELEKMTGLDEGGKAQQYIDSFILGHCANYVPGRHIHTAGVNATKIGSGLIIWDSPDANYLYEGKLMVDEETFSAWARPNTQKIMDPKNRDLKYHGGGLRNSKWAERMLEREFDDLIEGVQNIVRGDK